MSSVSNQTVRSISAQVTVAAAQNANIINYVVGTPNSEVSQALNNNLKKLIIRARDLADIKFSFVSGESGTKYVTIPKRASIELDALDFSSKTLYFQTSIATTVEILELY